MPTTKDSEKNEARSLKMKQVWAARRANAKKANARKEKLTDINTVEAWYELPTCLCCGEPLKKAKNPKHQSLWLPGHDAKMKGVALNVIRGKGGEIPEIAKVMRSKIGFLATRPELAPAFDK